MEVASNIQPKKIGLNVRRNGPQPRIFVRSFSQITKRVLPLKERLARTDRLIDQVVYRLYGLTEEEIGVVEGRE